MARLILALLVAAGPQAVLAANLAAVVVVQSWPLAFPSLAQELQVLANNPMAPSSQAQRVGSDQRCWALGDVLLQDGLLGSLASRMVVQGVPCTAMVLWGRLSDWAVGEVLHLVPSEGM